jgi:hypothetical protein
MNLFTFVNSRKISIKIGLLLCAIHIIFSIYIIGYVIEWSKNGQWQFAWIFPFLVDLPVSVLYVFIMTLPFKNISFLFLPYPISELRSFLLPAFFVSVIGSLWYFYLPGLIVSIIKFVQKFRRE